MSDLRQFKACDGAKGWHTPVAEALDEGLIAPADCHHLTGAAHPLIQGLQRLLDGAHALTTAFDAQRERLSGPSFMHLFAALAASPLISL